jgi:phospholipid transport system substrate-binding protein
MKRISILVLLILTLVANIQALADPESAYESVQRSTDALLARLVEVQPIYETDPDTFYAEVQRALEPYIDFDEFSSRVMSTHYEMATAEQRQAFSDRFRDALVRTYATALLEFDNQKVVVFPPSKPSPRPDLAVIMIEIHARSGTIYPVHYQLHRVGDRWLLRNVIINGINVGMQFRSQFNAYMQKYKGDISSVVKHWSVEVDP